MQIGGMGEDELLRRILPYLATSGYEVVAGADDAAVWREGDHFKVASCDTFVEGVHFDLAWMSAEDAGWRSLALALGDLAAKGATPARALAALTAPRSWAVDNLVGLYRGVHALASRVGLAVVGGDTSAIDGPAVLTLTVLGDTDLLPLARSQARPGWSFGVSGPLGAAAVALRERRALRLEPRLEEGRRLNRAGLCCGDVSDGLLREMQKFAAASGAGSLIRAADVPVAPGATWQDALTGGEEAELVCAGPEEALRAAGLRPVGLLTKDPAVRAVDPDGRPVEGLHGYDHFA
jgi:thiamine-monophosphate kinase